MGLQSHSGLDGLVPIGDQAISAPVVFMSASPGGSWLSAVPSADRLGKAL